MRNRFHPLLPILLVAAIAWMDRGLQSQNTPRILVAGKPRIGAELRIEVTVPSGSDAALLIDVAPGPIAVGHWVFHVGFTPYLLLLPLGPATPAPLAITAPIPPSPFLAGRTYYLQALALSGTSLALSAGTELTIAEPLPLDRVDDFTYRLQGTGGSDLTLEEIRASAFDLCIVDFSRNGLVEFTPSEIAALRSPAEPERIRLAYMSIGEAEDYRWYWPAISPSLIAASNPNWPGNFRVQYWEREWQEVIIHGNAAVGRSYLDRILDQGFDGVLLDTVDSFEFFGPVEQGGTNWRRNAAHEMVEFILAIAHHARVVRGHGEFAVIPHNAATLLAEAFYPPDTLGPATPSAPTAMAELVRERLLATVDGASVESVFHLGPDPRNNPFNPQTYLLPFLHEWIERELPVLALEYLTRSNLVAGLYTIHAPAHGFIPYATVPELDVMTVNAAFPPD